MHRTSSSPCLARRAVRPGSRPSRRRRARLVTSASRERVVATELHLAATSREAPRPRRSARAVRGAAQGEPGQHARRASGQMMMLHASLASPSACRRIPNRRANLRSAVSAHRHAVSGHRPAATGMRSAATGHRHGVSGHRPAARGQRSAARGQRSAARGTRHAARGTRHAVSGMRHAASGLRHAACGMRHAVSASGQRHAVAVRGGGPGPQRPAGRVGADQLEHGFSVGGQPPPLRGAALEAPMPHHDGSVDGTPSVIHGDWPAGSQYG